ncbi:MAG: alpha/beta hydrolase [Sphingobacteriaceae bacterium]|nr:MAG: alpha/beta hydrolase [Sphingobacteriaceae bacterium]
MISARPFLLMAFLFFGNKLSAQQAGIPLYPNGVPNSKPAPATYVEKKDGDWIFKVTEPTLTPYFPEKPNGTAVIVCPGGGYSGLASAHEGSDVAKAFNEFGVTAFVLKYRLPSDSIMVDKTIGPLQDAQRAVQIVRERAKEWKINPSKIGIMGFSAGGHFAATAITHFDKPVIDNKQNISLRPDFGVLIYPVISLGEYTHLGSKENLVGKDATQQLIDLYSNEKQVTAQTPPTFLVHSTDDLTVPVQNSIMFYDALIKNGVKKAEMHIYQSGGHGYGMNNKTTKDKWFESLKNWMTTNGWL